MFFFPGHAAYGESLNLKLKPGSTYLLINFLYNLAFLNDNWKTDILAIDNINNYNTVLFDYIHLVF
jgi:hypothetical protein